MLNSTPPIYTIEINSQIDCIGICNTDFGYNLMCVATSGKLVLGLLRFPEESECGTYGWEELKNIYFTKRCHALAFAPDTSLVVVPKQVTFCAAGGSDFALCLFRTDLDKQDTIQPLAGHTNYINDVGWSVDGEFLGSVSDDFSCKIWNSDSEYEDVITFCLSSAGVSIKWHPDEPNKVMVAEKKGIIRLYNVRSQQALISIEASKGPLMSADWSLNNRYLLTGLAGGDICTWDIRSPVTPKDMKQVHEDCGRVIRFSPSATDLAIASIGRPDVTLKVFTGKATLPLLEASLKLYGGMTWHHRLPYVIAANDRELFLYKVQVK